METVQIKMLVTKRASPDGVQVITYREGKEYSVPSDQLEGMFKEGEFSFVDPPEEEELQEEE